MRVFVSENFSTFYMNNRLAVLDNVHFEVVQYGDRDYRVFTVGEEGKCVKRFPKALNHENLGDALEYVTDAIKIFKQQAQLHREVLMAA